jgi:hypothetical protein
MKKISAVLSAAIVLGVGSLAHALTLTGAGGVGVQAGTGTQVQATGSFQGNASSGASAALINIDVNAGLQSQAQAISANTSSEDAVVQLQGNVINMIQTPADLDTYDHIVMKDRPVVVGINVNSDNSVAIKYAQPAKLFGIFPTSISSQVDVDTQGNATVHLPWWAFLYSKDTTGVQTSVATAVQQSRPLLNPSAQANTGVSATANTTDQVSVQNTARMISAVTAALQAQAQVDASANVATQ